MEEKKKNNKKHMEREEEDKAPSLCLWSEIFKQGVVTRTRQAYFAVA
jgi:hypothetical protein